MTKPSSLLPEYTVLVFSTILSFIIEELKFCKISQFFCVSVPLVRDNLRLLRENKKLIIRTKADHKCVCDLCGQELANHKSLERHMVIQHPTQDATDLVCEICAYSTPSKDKLRAHKFAKHEVEKHKQCPLCDFKSPTKVCILYL